MDKQKLILNNIQNSVDLKTAVLGNASIVNQIVSVGDAMVKCYQNKGKVLFCGNGGSAADSQHLSAELSGRYYYDRPPLSSEALHVNTSYLTAVANDYSYNEIYARLLKAIGNEGDVLISLSTSGNSANVVRAMEVAKELKMVNVAFTGEGGGKMGKLSEINIQIPSKDTPRIQECHMLIGHALCEMVEKTLFPK